MRRLNGDNFTKDAGFLTACLVYTSLSRHNKCLSFTTSDGVTYRNELCLDDGTLASSELDRRTRGDREQALIDQWRKVLDGARGTEKYNQARTYGLYQIDIDLNTSKRVPKLNRKTKETVYDYPVLNGDIRTLKAMLIAYHAEVIAPKLWEYGLLK